MLTEQVHSISVKNSRHRCNHLPQTQSAPIQEHTWGKLMNTLTHPHSKNRPQVATTHLLKTTCSSHTPLKAEETSASASHLLSGSQPSVCDDKQPFHLASVFVLAIKPNKRGVSPPATISIPVLGMTEIQKQVH